MAASFSPKPSFYLCPDFSIAPPPNGHLELGSILRDLDFDSIFCPLNYGSTIKIPSSHLRPRDGPSTKIGFSRSLRELRGLQGSIWANIFGSEGLGAKLSFFRNREKDETLTVEKLFVQYFIPTDEYMKDALDGVASHINNTKRKKPVYMITGLMWTEGAKLSKVKSKRNGVDGKFTATDPNSNTTFGGGGAYNSEKDFSSSFDGSTPFILGFRVRKIWWDKGGTRRDAENTVGTTLGDSRATNADALDGLVFVDDGKGNATGQTIIDESQTGEKEPVTWILTEALWTAGAH